MKLTRIYVSILSTALLLTAGANPLMAEPGAEAVATVNGRMIDQGQFLAFFNRARRQEYYHRTPPPDELEAFRAKTLRDLIDRMLLQDEAKKLGLTPDEEQVSKDLERITARYSGNPEWEAGKETMLASLRSQLEAGSLIKQIEATTRDVGLPDEPQLQAYFEAHPETFTEPAQRSVSLILVGLDPSALQTEREEALSEATALVDRLRAGEDFSMLAEAYSADSSAESGGDMGWLHVGLLNDQAEAALADMQPGQISDPVRTLEGYAILRLDETKAPEKKTLDQVRDRAVALWQREEGERAWQALLERLRDDADIQIVDPSLKTDSKPSAV